MSEAAASPAPAPARSDGPAIRLVIFDFDGTLSDSGDWFVSVVDELARKFKFRTVAEDEVDMLRHKSSREVIEFLGIPRWKLPLIARYVRRLVGRNAHEIELFPGTPDLLERLAGTGVKIALVTSNSEKNARLILGERNAGRIDFYACGSSLFGKAPKFRRVLKKLDIPAAETLSIGDETRDIDAAREVGMRAGSVLWGYASEEVLAGLRPDAMFRTPQDILDFVRHHVPLGPRDELRAEAADQSSPDVTVIDGRLDIAPNPRVDAPDPERSPEDAHETLRVLLCALVGALPGNVSRTMKSCLIAYQDHLDRWESKPIMGALIDLEARVRAIFRATDKAEWDEGLPDLFEQFFSRHAQLAGFFPGIEARERFLSETLVDEQAAQGEQLLEPVRQAGEALEQLAQMGLTTPAFNATVRLQQERATEVATLSDPPVRRKRASTGATPRQRLVLGQIGFYERVIAGIASLVTITAAPQLGAIVDAIQAAVRKLLALVL